MSRYNSWKLERRDSVRSSSSMIMLKYSKLMRTWGRFDLIFLI